jgi:hypothetical protein
MSRRKTTATADESATPTDRDELKQFAHHLAEAIRIARDNPILPARLYNGLANALNDFENDLPSLARVSESEAHIRLTIDAFIEQTTEQTEKGGAK